MKATINVTAKELDMLEDFITCYQLCKKHNRSNITNMGCYKLMWGGCKDCSALRDAHYHNAIRIWNKLCDAIENKNVRANK